MKHKSADIRLFCLIPAVLIVSVGIWLHQTSVNNKLMQAATGADFPAIRQSLGSRANINYHDKFGETALIAVTRKDRLDIVAYLLDKGADVNAQNIDGQTPLMNAAQFGYPKIADVLLNHGAKINTTDYNMTSAIDLAVGSEHMDVARLLISRGATVDPGVGDLPGAKDFLKKAKLPLPP